MTSVENIQPGLHWTAATQYTSHLSHTPLGQISSALHQRIILIKLLHHRNILIYKLTHIYSYNIYDLYNICVQCGGWLVQGGEGGRSGWVDSTERDAVRDSRESLLLPQPSHNLQVREDGEEIRPESSVDTK